MNKRPEESFPPIPDSEADAWADVFIDLAEKLVAIERGEKNCDQQPSIKGLDTAG